MILTGMIGPRALCRAFAAFVITIGVLAGGAHAQDSLIVKESPHSVGDTIDRLSAAAEEKGLNIFSRIDHAGGAEKAGLDLRPTQLLVIGNPNVGTPLMQTDQRLALSLPLRIASWRDENGSVWVGYWSPEVLAVQYGVSGQKERLQKMAGVLDALTDTAIAD